MPLDSAREALDRLDAEIVRLLDKRALLGRKIGEIKHKHQMALHHPGREAEVLQRIHRLSDGSFPVQGLERIFRTIMAETLALQKPTTDETRCGGAGGAGKRDVDAAVVENVPVAPGVNRMRLLVPALAGVFEPGQFFQIRIGESGSEFFLRRPFAPSEYWADGFAFHYSVVGAGTERMALMGPGQRVGVLAPLGRGFTLAEGGETAVLFGGGCGGPSLAPLAVRLREVGVSVVTVLGAKTAAALLHWQAFTDAGRLVTATDDGSHGCHGTVLDAFRRDCAELAESSATRYYACGPLPMLRAVAALAREKSAFCEVSLEERMACGFGACMGCAVPIRDGEGGSTYKRVCHEGPVFPAESVAWDEM